MATKRNDYVTEKMVWTRPNIEEGVNSSSKLQTGGRKRGRPKNSWRDGIDLEKIMKALEELQRMIHGKKWRKVYRATILTRKKL